MYTTIPYNELYPNYIKKILRALTFTYTQHFQELDLRALGREATVYDHEFLGGPLPSSFCTLQSFKLSFQQAMSPSPFHSTKEKRKKKTPKPKGKTQTITTRGGALSAPLELKGSWSSSEHLWQKQRYEKRE